MDAATAPESHVDRERLEARKRLDETIRPYVDKKTSYESSKESKSRPSESDLNADESETPDDEPALDDTQDLDVATILPASKSPQIAGATETFRFDELTPVSVFEDYLTDVQLMTYDEAFHRTSQITNVMLEYQAEWDRIDKECRDHEEAEKLKSMTAAEKEKALADEKQEEEDLILVSLEYTFREELKFSRKPWIEDFSAQFLEDNPDGQPTLDRLNKLRDASFFKGFKKRQRALQENRPEQLIDKPLPDPKQTKEERDLEARKRRHLTDSITFDDQLQADAYGFTYLASDLARGNQLFLPKVRVASLPKGLKAGSRPNRNATKGSMVESAENSEVPSGDEELPQKRARGKPRNFDVEQGASSAAESSRGTGSSKTYIGEDGKKRYVGSGKISGRPPVSTAGKGGAKVPKKSKLDQMSLAQQGERSDDNDDEEDQDGDADLDGDLSNGQVLLPGQEDELLASAADLATMVAIPAKKRGGGRPRNNKQLIQSEELPDASKSPRKPKGKGPLRSKKVDTFVLAGEDELEEAPENATFGKIKLGRKKRTREDDIAESADRNIDFNSKRVKIENRSIHLKIKPNGNGTTGLGERGDFGGIPMASIEPHVQSTQSSRPTTSSSKPTTTSKPTSRPGSPGISVPRVTAPGRASQPASRAISKPPTYTANLNGKRSYGLEYEAGTGGYIYDSYADDGVPASKHAKSATFQPGNFYGTLQQPHTNGDVQIGDNNIAAIPKVVKKRAPAKRKRAADGDEGLTTADGTNNNTDAEGGPNKKSKKSREKTAAEKESQSAAMKQKWADPNGKMRQGIDRRKRRDIRKGIEKTRTDAGGAPDPNVIYKSDEEGFEYAKWGETAPPPRPLGPPAGSTPTQTPDLPTPAEDGEFGNPIDNEPEDEFAVESPKHSSRPKTFSTDAATISTATGFGRQPQPSRRDNPFGGDGAADEDFDVEPPHRPAPLLAQKPKSAYEEFQTITSPGYHLEKRVSKPTFGYGGHNTSEEEEEY